MTSAQDHIDAFREAMASQGYTFKGDLIADGHIHRYHFDGDKPGKRNGWAVLYLDEHPAGTFGSWKGGGGERHTWSAKGVKPMSDRERREFARVVAERKAARDAAERDAQAKVAAFANAMWDAGTVAGDHPYLARKGISGEGLRVGVWEKRWKAPDGTEKVFRTPNTLLIPIRDGKRAIVSLQGVFAEPQDIGGDKRDKDFVTGGAKRGNRCTIGKPTEVDGQATVVICEGYATGASVHAATGLGVVVAFDAGNLLPVAEACRRIMPAARIVLAADNDQWTDRPIKNPGVTRAKEAATAVGGLVASPWFSDVSARPTDFNDLQALQGPDEVRRQIMAVIQPAQVPESEPEAEGSPLVHEDSAPPTARDGPGPALSNSYFSILGHDREYIYVYQHERKMVVRRSHADWGYPALLTLAPLTWWECHWFDKATKGGLTANGVRQAHSWLIRGAGARGFFNPNAIRGRGAWHDGDRLVFHFGHQLWVDGKIMPLRQIDSSYIYEQGDKLCLPAEEPMSAADGEKVIDMAKRFAWTREASGILLAGWCALAPIGGALGWRPHIWITGSAGAGKSTVMIEYVHWLMNGACIFANGNSTEPGIRQTLKIDALPILFEESEQNDQLARQRIQNILALFRQASTQSEARTLKGTSGGQALDYMVRSMACLASIQVGIEHQADLERIAVLGLRSKRDIPNAADAWRVLNEFLVEFRRDTTLPARMMRRSLMLLPITLQNIEIFAHAGAKRFGSRREGDQYGAMLAGAWSLTSDEIVTAEAAAELISRYDWSDHMENAKVDASQRALDTLLQRRIRDDRIELSVMEWIECALDSPGKAKNVEATEANRLLLRYGLRLDKLMGCSMLLVADYHRELQGLLKDTPFAADFKGLMRGLPGAQKVDTTYFSGNYARACAVPIALILGDGETAHRSDGGVDQMAAAGDSHTRRRDGLSLSA